MDIKELEDQKRRLEHRLEELNIGEAQMVEEAIKEGGEPAGRAMRASVAEMRKSIEEEMASVEEQINPERNKEEIEKELEGAKKELEEFDEETNKRRKEDYEAGREYDVVYMADRQEKRKEIEDRIKELEEKLRGNEELDIEEFRDSGIWDICEPIFQADQKIEVRNHFIKQDEKLSYMPSKIESKVNYGRVGSSIAGTVGTGSTGTNLGGVNSVKNASKNNLENSENARRKVINKEDEEKLDTIVKLQKAKYERDKQIKEMPKLIEKTKRDLLSRKFELDNKLLKAETELNRLKSERHKKLTGEVIQDVSEIDKQDRKVREEIAKIQRDKILLDKFYKAMTQREEKAKKEAEKITDEYLEDLKKSIEKLEKDKKQLNDKEDDSKNKTNQGDNTKENEDPLKGTTKRMKASGTENENTQGNEGNNSNNTSESGKGNNKKLNSLRVSANKDCVELVTEQGRLAIASTKGIKENILDKKDILKIAGIPNIIKELGINRVQAIGLKHKLDPNVVMAISKCEKANVFKKGTLKDYVRAISNRKKPEFGLEYDFENSSLDEDTQKEMERYAGYINKDRKKTKDIKETIYDKWTDFKNRIFQKKIGEPNEPVDIEESIKRAEEENKKVQEYQRFTATLKPENFEPKYGGDLQKVVNRSKEKKDQLMKDYGKTKEKDR